jgi:hypothetical protein
MASCGPVRGTVQVQVSRLDVSNASLFWYQWISNLFLSSGGERLNDLNLSRSSCSKTTTTTRWKASRYAPTPSETKSRRTFTSRR